MQAYRPFSRGEFYRHAIANLGVFNTVRRAISQKRSGKIMHLGSRDLDHLVKVRRDTSDMYTFDTIFVEREYSCLDDLTNVRTVLDAGANCGYSSAFFLSRFPKCRVLAIEPDPANYKMTVDNLAAFGSRATTVRGAVWSRDTRLRFDDDSMAVNNEWGRRTLEGDGGIEAFSIPSLMKTYGMDRIDILKVDIEGAEKAVFGASDTSWLDSVRNLVIEPHGLDCEAAIEAAMTAYSYERSTSGELLVFKNIERGRSAG